MNTPLNLSENNLIKILNNTHDAILIHSATGKVLYVNDTALKMFKMPSESFYGHNLLEGYFSTPDNPFENLTDWWAQTLNDRPKSFEWKMKKSDGVIFYAVVSLRKIILDDTALLMAHIQDITEIKIVQSVLRENEEKFRALVENSQDAIIRYDEDNRHLYVNPQVERLTEKTSYLFIGKTPRELGFSDSLSDFTGKSLEKVFASGKVFRAEYQHTNGLWNDYMFIPELDESGRVKAVTVSARDITGIKSAEEERSKLEAKLHQAQKMESLGRLAGGVAHDFSNMLNVILGRTELSLNDQKITGQIKENLEEIQLAAQRSASLTRQLLGFARKQTVIPVKLDLNRTIDTSIKLLARLIGENISLSQYKKEGLWSVNMDPTQIDQILTNLCVNARDAIEGSGKIIIETDNITFDPVYCKNHTGFTPGDYVMIAVSDTGHGMSRETQSRLFEPFFTTKIAGQGTGMGLATVYGIVKQNKGFINVYSEPGMGSTFKVYLPRYYGQEEIPAEKKPEYTHIGGDETILFVEDEPLNLKLGKLMLSSLGYRILTTSSPNEALRICRESDQRIDLLITDIIMPEMNGKELSQKITSIQPEIRVIYISGYTANIMINNETLDKNINYLSKPYSFEEMSKMVRSVLDEKKEMDQVE
jgi:PAS domain S-box-containing protein